MTRANSKPYLSLAIAVVICLGSTLAPAEAWSHQQTKPAASPEIALAFNPAQSSVHWTLDSTLHTVHGTFTLTSGTVSVNPATGNVDGEIVVSAKSGQTENSSRDARMHKEILETVKYPDAIFRPTQVEGVVARLGASDVKLHGILTLHAPTTIWSQRFTWNFRRTPGKVLAHSRCRMWHGELEIPAIFS